MFGINRAKVAHSSLYRVGNHVGVRRSGEAFEDGLVEHILEDLDSALADADPAMVASREAVERDALPSMGACDRRERPPRRSHCAIAVSR